MKGYELPETTMRYLKDGWLYGPFGSYEKMDFSPSKIASRLIIREARFVSKCKLPRRAPFGRKCA